MPPAPRPHACLSLLPARGWALLCLPARPSPCRLAPRNACRLEFEGGPLLLLKRFGFRWVFVAATAAVAVCLPFMGELMGLVGEGLLC